MDENKSSGGSVASSQLTAEAAIELQEGIDLMLSRWTAFQLALRNEWGGPHTRSILQQLADDLLSLLLRSEDKAEAYELATIIDDAMISVNTEVKDGSINEISEKLVSMREECLKGDFCSIKRLRATSRPTGAVPHGTKLQNSESDDDDDGVNEYYVNYDSTKVLAGVAQPHSAVNIGEIMFEESRNSAKMVVDVAQTHSAMNGGQIMFEESRNQKPAKAENGWTVASNQKRRRKYGKTKICH